jgi:hypothetical protein
MRITAQSVAIGKQIEPLKRVFLFSPEEFETFISEWLELKRSQYYQIENLGGAGDMGSDVAAYHEDPQIKPDTYKWDCYQCKHYDVPLSPSKVWSEFGKIIYYSYLKQYPVPQNYFLVAPKGVGSKLSSLLRNPPKIKSSLLEKWDEKCRTEITKKEEIILEGDFLNYFSNFDFSIFKKININDVIEEHKDHPNHLIKFGGGLPERNKSVTVPDSPENKELRYIHQLILAYNSESENDLKAITHLYGKYESHFNRARESFYNAEELRNFSRDNLPAEVYDDFILNIYDGIINLAENEYENGFTKVKEVEDSSVKISIESNPLREVCNTIDKKGVCHQLVNDNKISWINEDE